MWLLLFVACSPTDDPIAGSDTGTPPETDLTGIPDGSYFVGLAVASVGGLAVPLQLTVEARGSVDGPVFSTMSLRAVDGDEVSDVLVTLDDVAVTVDGGFDADLPEFTLPGAYSITGSDVAVNARLVADSVSEDRFCGTVTGELVTFSLDLAGSTFGATAWDQREDAPPTGCEENDEEVPRIEVCPPLTDGPNSGFPSGGADRSFEVVLPADYPAGAPYPLVFVFHGFGGTSEGMLGSGLRAMADDRSAILVVPQGEDIGGDVGWDAFSDPRTNLDAVLFDDLLTCASESFDVDPEHVHVTGMSNGGLFTGYLIATRNDRIASAAPMSGGISAPWVESGHAVPTLVIWGGESDFAFEQDFDLLAGQMVDQCVDHAAFVAKCDHGLGHTYDASYWPWIFDFLLDHPYTLGAEPYASGLPVSFPPFCSIF